MYRDMIKRLTVKEVLTFYGVKFKGDNKCYCPFHNDKHPSMQITERKNQWYCHTCGVGGDIINFVAKLNDCKNHEAFKTIDHDFKLGLYKDKLSREDIIKAQQEKRKREEKKRKAQERENLIDSLCEQFRIWNTICYEEMPQRGREPSNLWIYANSKRIEVEEKINCFLM